MQSSLPNSASTIMPPGPASLTAAASSLPGRVAICFAATVFVAVCAHISFPLPFTPVPLSLQNFGVTLVGLILGPVAGFSAMCLYLAEGAAGLPVFTPHGLGGLAQLLGPTAGYLASYPLVAALAGAIVRRGDSRATGFTRALAAGILSSVPLFLMGPAWLAHVAHLGSAATWHLAVAPFLPGEAVKMVASAGIYSSLQRWRKF